MNIDGELSDCMVCDGHCDGGEQMIGGGCSNGGG